MTMKTSKISKKRSPSPIGSNTCTSSSSCARSVADIGDHGLIILSVVSYHDELIAARFFPCYEVIQTVRVFCALSLTASSPPNICFSSPSALFICLKIEVVFFLIVLSRNLLYSVISITSSFLFFSVHDILILLLMYHISVVCNHCKTLFVKKRDTDQSEILIREKQYDSTADSGLFTPADTLRKVLNAAEHSYRAHASSLLTSTALRFKLVKNMIHATKKKQQQQQQQQKNYHMVCLKESVILYPIYSSKLVCQYLPSSPHQRIKHFHFSSKSAKNGKRKVSTLRHL